MLETDIEISHNSNTQLHQSKKLLRFITCGSVDDGKSTLIGRLLHDAHLIYEDQLAALKRDSKKYNTTQDEMDLALLTDGLQAEREQGITIDVAYRYFSTDKRKFIIADTPGHEQYTRNMVTGASNSDLAIILLDARTGIKEQTRRHHYIVSLLGIEHIVVAVNKMDRVDYSEDVFQTICRNYQELVKALPVKEITFIPVSALKGDNIVKQSQAMPWYQGPVLLPWLEQVEVSNINEKDNLHFRMPVQYVNRFSSDFRGYSGTIARGMIQCGDEVMVLPSGKKSHVKAIVTFDGDLNAAEKGQAVTLTLEKEIDISRGDMIVHPNYPPTLSDNLTAMLVWMSETPLQPHRQYQFKFANKMVFGHVDLINFQMNINSLEKETVLHLNLNAIGQCQIKLDQRLAFDNYVDCRTTGSFIMIDRLSNDTVAAGLIIGASQGEEAPKFSDFELELNMLIRKHFPHWQTRDLRELLNDRDS